MDEGKPANSNISNHVEENDTNPVDENTANLETDESPPIGEQSPVKEQAPDEEQSSIKESSPTELAPGLSKNKDKGEAEIQPTKELSPEDYQTPVKQYIQPVQTPEAQVPGPSSQPTETKEQVGSTKAAQNNPPSQQPAAEEPVPRRMRTIKKRMFIDYNRAMTPILRTTWTSPPKQVKLNNIGFNPRATNRTDVNIHRSPQPDKNGNYQMIQTEPYIPSGPRRVVGSAKIEIHGIQAEGRALAEKLSPKNSPSRNVNSRTFNSERKPALYANPMYVQQTSGYQMQSIPAPQKFIKRQTSKLTLNSAQKPNMYVATPIYSVSKQKVTTPRRGIRNRNRTYATSNSPPIVVRNQIVINPQRGSNQTMFNPKYVQPQRNTVKAQENLFRSPIRTVSREVSPTPANP